jgi:tetratricopeptide (TPR) repeat protein
MKKRLGLMVATAIALVIAVYFPRPGNACIPGAFMLERIFINTLHPDLPIGPYTQGNLGVIQPTYWGLYLYVAYRNLAGPAVRPSEEEALWRGDGRLLTGHAAAYPGENTESQQEAQADTHTNWQHAWEAQTGQARPPEHDAFSSVFQAFQPWTGIYRQIAVHESNLVFYTQFLNCPQDAFHQALSTLKLRSQQFGEKNPVVQRWIEAQEVVFANCSAGSKIPEALPGSAPAIARADRAYQIAAAHFYAGDYDKAAADFRAIAQDQSSPWSTIAPYLVARALVRKATVTDRWTPEVAALAPAETQVESVLADPRLQPYHRAAEQLRALIEFYLHPDQRLVELADALTKKVTNDPNLAQDLTDFRVLFGKAGNARFPAELRAQSKLLDWTTRRVIVTRSTNGRPRIPRFGWSRHSPRQRRTARAHLICWRRRVRSLPTHPLTNPSPSMDYACCCSKARKARCASAWRTCKSARWVPPRRTLPLHPRP